jgi:hypothetical protein
VQQEGFELRRLYRVPNLEKQRVRELMRSRMKVDSATGVITGPVTISIGGGTITTGDAGDSAAYYRSVLRQPDFTEIMGTHLLTADSLVTPSENPRFKLFGFDQLLLAQFTREPLSDEYMRTYMLSKRSAPQTTRLFLINGAIQVEIEANGNYYSPLDLLTDGYMGFEKTGDLLPLDYEPPADN